MAGAATWGAVTNNELVCHDEVVKAVAAGALQWDSTNPGLAGGYCYTRADFEAHLIHGDMSGSGLASNECMSKGEMLQYGAVNPAIGSAFSDAEWVSEPATWHARAQYSVSATVLSVLAEQSIDGGEYAPLSTHNVTGGSSGNLTGYSDTISADDSLVIRLTPYTGANATGTAGDAVEVFPAPPPV